MSSAPAATAVPHTILQIVPSLESQGAAGQVALLAAGLDRQRFDCEVAVLSAASPRGPVELPSMRIHRIDCRFGCDPVALLRLRHLTRTRRPKLLHAWGLPAMGYALLACRLAGDVPLVVTDLRSEPTAELDWSCRRVIAAARGIATASPLLGAWWRAQGAEQVTDIPPAVASPARDEVARAAWRLALALPDDSLVVGIVAPLVAESRVQDLLWAVDLLREIDGRTRCVVLGSGPQRGTLVEFARRAVLGDGVRFLPEDADVDQLLCGSDVFWQASPSHFWPDGVLRAQAAGVPVVVDDSWPHRELVRHGATGYLVGPGARADRARLTHALFTDHALRQRLVENAGRHVLDRHTPGRMVERYADLYGRAPGERVS